MQRTARAGPGQHIYSAACASKDAGSRGEEGEKEMRASGSKAGSCGGEARGCSTGCSSWASGSGEVGGDREGASVGVGETAAA